MAFLYWYILLISIPVTFFFNIVLKHKKLSNMISLFIVTAIITTLALYFILRNSNDTINVLSSKSALGFLAFFGFVVLILLLRRVLQENIYTLNGAVFITIFLLLLVIVYNFVQILMYTS